MMRTTLRSVVVGAVLIGFVLAGPTSYAAPEMADVVGTVVSIATDTLTLTPIYMKSSLLVRITTETNVLDRKKATLTDLHRGDMVRVLARKPAVGGGLRIAETITGGWIDSLPPDFRLSSAPHLPAGWIPEFPIVGRLVQMEPVPLERAPMMGLWVRRTDSNSNNGDPPVAIAAAETVPVSRLVVTPRSSLKPAVRVSVLGKIHMDGSLTAAIIAVLGPVDDVY